jgi:hypothetical protein
VSVFRPTRLLALLALAIAGAAPSAPTVVPVPGHGALQLTLPSGWRARIQQPPGDLPPTVRIEPASGREFGILVTALWSREGSVPTLEELRPRVEDAASDLLPSAVETALPLEELRGPSVTGFYFTATDRDPKAGEWTHVTQGLARVGSLILNFTILTNGKEAAARKGALAMIGSASHDAAAAAAAPTDPSAPLRLALPGRSWGVTLDLPGFQLGQREERPDGQGVMVLGVVPATGVNFSAYVEAIPSAKGVLDCRKHYWDEGANRNAVPKTGVKLSEGDGVARVEYLVPSFEGVDVRQQHVHAYRYRDGACVAAHASKVGYVPADAPALDKALAGVRVR